jgi:hypothetical protein
LGVPAARGAQLLAASGFALAQPLFDLLGKNAEFFAVRGSTPSDIVLFALVVTFGPALVLLAVELLVALVSEVAAQVLHLVFLGFLGAVFGVQALKRSGVDGTTVLIAGSVLVGVGIAVAAWRWRAARSFLTVLGVAPLLFLALFLFDSPTSKLVISSGDAQAAAIRVRATDARRLPALRRVSGDRPPAARRRNRRQAVPELREARRRLDLVPEHHDPVGVDDGRCAGDPHRAEAEEGRAADLSRPPEQPLHAAGAALSHARDRVADASLPAEALQAQGREHGVAALVPVLGREGRVPAPDRAAGAGGPAARDRRVVGELRLELARGGARFGRLGLGGAEGEPEDLLPRAGQGLQPLRRVVRKPGNGPPTLYFIHVLLPHTPWLYLPDGHARAVAAPNAPGRNGELWFNGQLAVQAWQRHLLQLGYTDRLVGKFLRRLHQTRLWDKALVVVTADHGVSFRGGDLRRRPTRTNLAELAFTPLFMKLPGEDQGRVVDTHVQTVDILPTMAAALGIKIPWKTDGRSVLTGTRPPTRVNVAGVSASYSHALAQRQASLARQLGLFGSGSWGPQFAAPGSTGGSSERASRRSPRQLRRVPPRTSTRSAADCS